MCNIRKSKSGTANLCTALAVSMTMLLSSGCGSRASEQASTLEGASTNSAVVETYPIEDSETSGKEQNTNSQLSSEENNHTPKMTDDGASETDTAHSDENPDLSELELSDETEDVPDTLTETQRNSINMLNYLTVLTQEINASKSSRVFLEDAYSSLINNTYPNAVDTRTQSQMMSLLDTLENYRMITEKRERLDYIYEQSRAQAMRQAIPNPIGLLSAVESGSLLKAAASVAYMAVDSVSSYSSSCSQADLQYLQDGWQLDDEEAETLHNSRKEAFAYVINMVRDNSLPGDYALNEEAVQQFVDWENSENLVRKIAWLETNQETYREFGPYWLAMAKAYYSAEEYQKCLDSVQQYEKVASRIFRKDHDYAETLPMAIISAKEIYSKKEYVNIAKDYASAILDNTGNDEWTLRYFAAQIYLDLYAVTGATGYMETAYQVAFDNVNNLVDEQYAQNETFLSDIEEIETPKDATKREKEEIKQYNKLLKEERKTELPPVSEAVYLNCDLLFSLAKELNVSAEEQGNIESMIHEGGTPLFLTSALDQRFWFDGTETLDIHSLEAGFHGDSLTIPAVCVTDRSTIQVNVTGETGETVIGDWTIRKVERPKKADYTDYMATFTSESADSYEYKEGDIVQVEIIPVAETPEESLTFEYQAKAEKKFLVLDSVVFERMQ